MLQAFFTDRLIAQRSASPTRSPATATPSGCCSASPAPRPARQPSALDIDDLDAPLIGAFLNHLERDRGNTARTRNWRLAAIHSLFGYAALHHPEHAATIQRVLAIPPKRYQRNVVTWLTEPKPTPCSPHPTAPPGPGDATTPCSSSPSRPGYASPN